MTTSYQMKPVMDDFRKIAFYLEKREHFLDAEIARFIASCVETREDRRDYFVKIASTDPNKNKAYQNYIDGMVELVASFDDFAVTLKEAEMEELYPVFNNAMCNFCKYAYANNITHLMKQSGVWDTIKGIGRGVGRALFGPWMGDINKEKYLTNVNKIEGLEENLKNYMIRLRKARTVEDFQTTWEAAIGEVEVFKRDFARIASKAAVSEDVYNFVLGNAVVEAANELERHVEGQTDANVYIQTIASFIKTMMNVRRGISGFHTQYGIGANSSQLQQGQHNQYGNMRDDSYPHLASVSKNFKKKIAQIQQNRGPLDPNSAFHRKFYITRERMEGAINKYGQRAKQIFHELGVPDDWYEYASGQVDPLTGRPRDRHQRYPTDLLAQNVDAAMKQFQQNIANFIQRYPAAAEDTLNKIGLPIRHRSWYGEGVANRDNKYNKNRGEWGRFSDPNYKDYHRERDEWI